MKAQKKLRDYMYEMGFELKGEITPEDLKRLEGKTGYIIRGRVPLYIMRCLSVHEVIGVATVMESIDYYQVLDPFGIQLWKGPAEEAIDYIKGFSGGAEE